MEKKERKKERKRKKRRKLGRLHQGIEKKMFRVGNKESRKKEVNNGGWSQPMDDVRSRMGMRCGGDFSRT